MSDKLVAGAMLREKTKLHQQDVPRLMNFINGLFGTILRKPMETCDREKYDNRNL